MKSLSHVRLFATPWTVAHEAPPSMGFSPGKNTGVGAIPFSNQDTYQVLGKGLIRSRHSVNTGYRY